jgi:GNAT superfamily N-acetyltransferase
MNEKSSTITEGSKTGSRVVYPKDAIVFPTQRNEEQIGILLRKIEPDERALGFVLDSWCKTVAAEPPWDYSTPHHTTPLPPSVMIYEHDIILKKLIPHSTIILACDPSDPDTVWWNGKTPDKVNLLHFIYVKSAFRGFGIGGCLLRASGLYRNNIITSHRTKSLFVAFPSVRFLWNPYRMIYGT